MEKVSCSSLVNKESSPEEGKELTIDGHDRGTKESHRHREKNAEAVGLKGMSKEERDIELAEMKAELSHLEKLVLKGIREKWKQGFYVGRRVKWPVRELFAEKLLLRRTENEEVEYICEPEKGPLLGDEDSDDSREELIYADQNERNVLTSSAQTRGSHIFGINYFCECKIAGMQPKEFEPVYEKVKGAKARQARKEMHKDFQDFNWWRKLKGMAEWLCLLLVETYWIIFEGILAWK